MVARKRALLGLAMIRARQNGGESQATIARKMGSSAFSRSALTSRLTVTGCATTRAKRSKAERAKPES